MSTISFSKILAEAGDTEFKKENKWNYTITLIQNASMKERKTQFC
jgi:hypothetical protein